MEENVPYTPTDVIELANNQYNELAIKYVDFKGGWDSFYGLFDRFFYAFDTDVIIVQDLFLGTEMYDLKTNSILFNLGKLFQKYPTKLHVSTHISFYQKVADLLSTKHLG
jgi:hypothetical protein